MTVLCPECGRLFGGAGAYERHLVRREDRCKNAREMQQTELVYKRGVWHKPAIDPQPTLFDKRKVVRREQGDPV